MKSLAFVGIGNSLVGDDGVGPAALQRLEEAWGTHPEIIFMHLETDLFSLTDHLDRAKRFVFLDAIAGDKPGAIVQCQTYHRGFAPSFHQADLFQVMRLLRDSEIVHPFPEWEVWGVVIEPPVEFNNGLSPHISKSVNDLCQMLHKQIPFWL